MLGAEALTALQEFYDVHFENIEGGFFPSMFTSDRDLKNKVTDVIERCFNDALSHELSDDYKILYGNFMVKYPGSESFMKIHQDWTYVAEPFHESYAIWVPLVATNLDNGALQVVPKSHLIPNYKRGPGMDNPFYPYSRMLMKDFSSLQNLAPGEALCWNHRLVHYSTPNLTAMPRVAVTAIFVPRKARVIHYFKKDVEDVLRGYAVDRDFFHEYKIGLGPDRPIIESENYVPMKVAQEEITLTLKTGRPKTT